MALVLLRQFPTSIEAAIARSHLKAQGVHSFLFDVENEWNTDYRPVEGVRLMVCEEDLQEAAEVLRAVDAEAGE